MRFGHGAQCRRRLLPFGIRRLYLCRSRGACLPSDTTPATQPATTRGSATYVVVTSSQPAMASLSDPVFLSLAVISSVSRTVRSPFHEGKDKIRQANRAAVEKQHVWHSKIKKTNPSYVRVPRKGENGWNRRVHELGGTAMYKHGLTASEKATWMHGSERRDCILPNGTNHRVPGNVRDVPL